MSAISFMGSDAMFEPISIGMYSDGTPMVKTLGFDRIVRKAHTMVLRPTNLNDFVTAMFLYDALVDAGCLTMRLVLPYLPGARQDRSNPTGDVLFTARSVARMINERPFSKVISIDPHSPVMPERIDHFVEYPLSEVAKKVPFKYNGIIAADKGGQDRAEQFAEALNLPVFYGGKTRDVSTGKLTGFTLEPLALTGTEYQEDGHYLVVDDICDGGGTFIGLCEKIREQGAHADLYVTHGIFAKGTATLRQFYDNIITTDSLPQKYEHSLTILPVVKEMENYNA